MQEPADLNAVVKACHDAAEKLIEASTAVKKPGSYHIAYHLATLALEEIGKASTVFMDSRGVDSKKLGGEDRSLMEWIDDHERKLFWAIWLPTFHMNLAWQTIPWAMTFARRIHQTRVDTLYLNPNDLNAASTITEERVNNIINLASAGLEMERAKTYRQL